MKSNTFESVSLRIFGLLFVLGLLTSIFSFAFSDPGISYAWGDPSGQYVTAKLDGDCNATEWHFVITGITGNIQAPDSIRVHWGNVYEEVPRVAVTGETAHYSTTHYLDKTVTLAEVYMSKSWSGQFNLSHGPCAENPSPNPTPTEGSITICKAIVDKDGNIVDGDGTDSTFSISGLDFGDHAGVLQTTTFDTPLTFTDDVFSYDQGNNVECVRYDHLALGSYYYDEETIDSGDQCSVDWMTPLYNDQYSTSVQDTSDFYPYSDELFTPDTSDDANRNENADGHIILTSDRPDRTLVVLNQYKQKVEPPKPQPVTLSATKIVCDAEADLPNWSGADISIGATTATDFLASHLNCSLTSGWSFQYASAGVANPGDNTGEATSDWTTFGSTDSDGVATTTVDQNVLDSGRIWVREVMQDGYIPFSGVGGGNVSAEMYCNTDVLNYDNYDYINNPKAGNTYYCVAFNALKTPPPTTQCNDGNDNDQDGLTDSEDPGCWTDPNDPNTYDASRDSENQKPVIQLTGDASVTLTVGDSYTDAGATASDQEDGDITSKIITVNPVDTNTAGTYTITYNATDSEDVAADEVTRTVTVNNPTPPTTECNDGADNDGDGLKDINDPGCHQGDDPNNPYDPTDDSENAKPVIQLIGDATITLTVGDTYTDDGATAHDQEDGDITSKIITVNPVDTNTAGTYTITYNATDSEDVAADEVTRTVTVELPPQPGVITVCKMIVDENNLVATSSLELPAGTFSVALATTTDIGATTLNTTSWDAASFTPNQMFTTSENDAECVTYSNLPLGPYYYGEEATSSMRWISAKYNDGDVHSVNNISDFSPYDNALFTSDTSDDAGRDTNADGNIVLTADRYERTLVVLNKFNATPLTQCNDGADNDGDGLKDINDPGCHQGDDQNNPYDPTDDSENQKPVITLIGPSSVDVVLNHAYTEDGAHVDDPEEGSIDDKLLIDSSTIDTTTLGTYTVTYNATDSENVAADQVTRTVNVVAVAQCGDTIDNDGDTLVDTDDPGCHTDGDPNNPNSYDAGDNSENQKPVITLQGDPTVTLTVGNSYNDAGATANDPEDGPVPVVTVNPVDTGVAGTYTITYNATDSEDVAADEVTRTVHVNNPTPPTPVCTNCGGGGGGGGPIVDTLRIFNEKVTVVSEGAAIITWDTNKPATSRVVYDNQSHTVSASTLNFGTDGTNLDYATSTTEDTALATSHSVLVTNINLTDTFYFRPISVASSRAIGNELSAVLGEVSLGGSCSEYLHEFIKLGANNNPDEVTKLQQFLNQFENADLPVTGLYGEATYAAVQKFQDKYAGEVLTPWGLQGHTGYVYLTTRKKINEIYCKGQLTFPLTASQQAEIAAFRTLVQSQSTQGLPTPSSSEVGQAPETTNTGLAETGTSNKPSITFTEEKTGSEDLAAGSEATTSLASVVEANQSTSTVFQKIGNFFKNFFR